MYHLKEIEDFMLKNFTVEIVIPIYNEERELGENINKLHSFLNKKLTDYLWRVTIVDNASNDNSLTIAKKLSREKWKLRLLILE